MNLLCCRWCLLQTSWHSRTEVTTGGHRRDTLICSVQENTGKTYAIWVIPEADSVKFLISLLFTKYISTLHKLWQVTTADWQDEQFTPQRWAVLGFWTRRRKTPCSVPSLPTGWHPQCPLCPVGSLAPLQPLQLSGHLWTLPWALLPAALPVFSPIPWKSSRPVCSFRENCGHGVPIRDTTVACCRPCGWWAAQTGCAACRKGSQLGWSIRVWWMVCGWDPTPIVKLWVSPPCLEGVCCQGLGLGRWVPLLPLLPTW